MAIIEWTRKPMVGILRTLELVDFQRRGGHSRDGVLTLEVLLQRITAQVPHHIRFIKEKRQGLRTINYFGSK